MKKEELVKNVIELKHAICGNGTIGINDRLKRVEKKLDKFLIYISMAMGGGVVIVFILEKIFFN